MAQDTGLPDIQLDSAALYREDIFTDRKVGTIRRLTPVTADGGADATRPVLYVGQAQVMTPVGALPISFDLPADGSFKRVEDQEVHVTFPVANVKDLQPYEVFIGIQLSKAELDYNQKHSFH